MATDPRQVRDILTSAKRIAVVGLSPKPERPSHGVAQYLQRAGYRIIPVRPGPEGTILGEPIVPDLAAARKTGPIDVVDIFRRSSAIPELVSDILAVRPRLVWMQQGVEDADSAARIEAAGIPVVMDQCLAVEHHSMVRS
ncbi:MAG: CoA-binding protein [Gemmatimonadota bacterium]